MEFEFTILDTLWVYFAFVNGRMLPEMWRAEEEAEAKFMLNQEIREEWGIEYQELGFSLTIPALRGKKPEEIWQALSAPTVMLDLTRADIEIALRALSVCAFHRAERDYIFRLIAKLEKYQQSFQALEALNQLPREMVMKVAEGKLQ